MAKKIIYLTRHGQTDFNKRGIVQGSGIDSSINETGKTQALQFYSKYNGVKFDKVYTSELKRTIQSVQKFIDDSVPHEIMPELNEINWGIMEGKEADDNQRKQFDSIIQKWNNGFLDYAIENGESPNQMAKRQIQGLKKIIDKTEEETILICMHGRAMRCFLCILLQIPLSKMDDFEHTNLCLYLLTYENNIFEINVKNDQSHLR